IIFLLGDSLKELVDVATTISFLVAPLIATVNLRLVTSRHMPAAGQPPRWLRWLSYAGIVFLTGFALVYLFL
ncbi:MAG: divalent metal cation transporter, partial [Schleiferiaceae bacterium]|nr:divalent metal cation transporter [Schleiferiaceae bacterium]